MPYPRCTCRPSARGQSFALCSGLGLCLGGAPRLRGNRPVSRVASMVSKLHAIEQIQQEAASMASKAEIRFPHGPQTGAGAGAGGGGSGTPGSNIKPAHRQSSGLRQLFSTSRGAPAFASTRPRPARRQARCSAVSPSSFCQPSVRRVRVVQQQLDAAVEASGTPCRG